MTREELDEHINYVSHTACGYPPISIMASEVERWLKDIRDNGIEPAKKYRILVKHIENSYYEMWLFYEGDGVFNTVSDKAEINTVRSFTRTQIEDLKKNDDVAIDWNKAVIAVGEDK